MEYEVITTPHFDKWLKRVKDPQGKAAVTSRVERLKEGQLGDADPVGEGYSELRIFVGKGYRVYIKRTKGTIYVVLTGGIKSSKKAQTEDIKRAKEIGKEYGL